MNNKIKEVIVVEGRDDENAIYRALSADTIATHGFGIRKETWELMEKAYRERGLIIFTDPDFSGEEIRKKINARFPDSKNAYLSREEATDNGDIGIENASPDSILRALEKACCTLTESREEFTAEDLAQAGLTGDPSASFRRTALGRRLGIGYGNSKAFLKKLNQFGITREEFIRECQRLKEEENQ
jgi:ribonuclease M5